jgi:hypothetical protein
MTKKRTCAHPGCTKLGIFKIEADAWLCTEHMIEALHHPWAIQMRDADEELAEHLDKGGKLS